MSENKLLTACYILGVIVAWGFFVAAGYNSEYKDDLFLAAVFGWCPAMAWPVFVCAVFFHYAMF